jgi:hypothetical protein
MPIEIRDMHITVTVNQPQQGQEAGTDSAAGTGKGDKDAMIAQCIEQTLDIINSKKER